MLDLHIAYTRIVVVFMTCFYIVSVLNKPRIHHRSTGNKNVKYAPRSCNDISISTGIGVEPRKLCQARDQPSETHYGDDVR
jgi:hypothetical protein